MINKEKGFTNEIAKCIRHDLCKKYNFFLKIMYFFQKRNVCLLNILSSF